VYLGIHSKSLSAGDDACVATSSNTAEFMRDFEFFKKPSRQRALASLDQGLAAR
jgi:hypothetical protein